MARLLNATGYVSSVLATVCLILALIAAPIGEARADEPTGPGDSGLTCSGQNPCSSPTHCHGFCLLFWEDCGCGSLPGQSNSRCQCHEW